MLVKIKEIEPSVDIRELILAKESREAAHNPGAIRPKVNDHLNNFVFNNSKKYPKPRGIILFDDIITSGAHFKAAQTIIKKVWSEIPLIGIFVARNVKIEDVN